MAEPSNEGGRPEISIGNHPDEMVMVGVYGKNVAVPWYCLSRECPEISPEAAAEHLGIWPEIGQLSLLPSVQPGYSRNQEEIIREQVALKAKAIGPRACRQLCIFKKHQKLVDEETKS